MVSRIAVIAMASLENIQFPKTRFLQGNGCGKTLAQLEPMPRKGGKEMIAVPAELMDELSKARFFVDAAFCVEKAVESTSVSQDSI